MKKVVFIILPLAICLLLLVYAPIEIYASNIEDVDYDLFDLGKVLLPLFIAGFTVISGLSLAACRFTRGKLQKIWAGLLLFILSFLCIQGTFFSSNIPVLDGDSIVWSSFSIERLVSVVLFLITGTVVILLLAFLDEKKFSSLCIFTDTVLSSLMVLSLLLMCFTKVFTLAVKTVLCGHSGSG